MAVLFARTLTNLIQVFGGGLLLGLLAGIFISRFFNPQKSVTVCQPAKNSALEQLIITEKAARAFGFDWPNVEMIIDQAVSECQEICEALANKESSARVQEEIGDLLHTAVSLCIFAGFDVDATLASVEAKFAHRMKLLKQIAHTNGFENLHGQPIDVLLNLWREAKELEKI